MHCSLLNALTNIKKQDLIVMDNCTKHSLLYWHYACFPTLFTCRYTKFVIPKLHHYHSKRNIWNCGHYSEDAVCLVADVKSMQINKRKSSSITAGCQSWQTAFCLMFSQQEINYKWKETVGKDADYHCLILFHSLGCSCQSLLYH